MKVVIIGVSFVIERLARAVVVLILQFCELLELSNFTRNSLNKEQLL